MEAKSEEIEKRLVTLDVKQVPIQEVFKEITRQTGVAFSYESSLVKECRPVTLKVKQMPLDRCLQELFRGFSLTYHSTGNFIIVKKKPQKVTVSGFIRDHASSESLIGASVYDCHSRRGVAANVDGFFSLTLEGDSTAELEVSYVGYGSRRYLFPSIKKDTTLQVLLSTHQQLDEVVVTSNYVVTDPVTNPQMGQVRLTRESIKRTPVLFGEADIIKSLQNLPGVSPGTAGLAGMYVRGGNSDGNLYMIEGNPLYQVNHVGGLFSAFSADAVKDVEFFKSAFPARYGGRLSSVVDVHTKDGNMKEHHGSAMLGLTSGSLNFEGPIVKDRTSFNFSLRRSWLDVLSIPALAIWNATKKEGENEFIARYAFTDLNLKLNHKFTDRSRAYAGLYFGNDFLKGGVKDKGGNGYEQKDVSRLRWGNLMPFAGWSYVFNNQLFGNLNMAYTHYASTLERELSVGTPENRTENKAVRKNGINDVSVRANFDYLPTSSYHLHFGANYIYHHFHPQNNTLRAHELGIYAENDWNINRIVRLNGGLRFGLYAIEGKSYLSLEPRFSGRFLLTPKWSLKASYARMSQYVHQISESYISLPTDTWMPVSRNLKPMVSDQVSLGVYHSLTNGYSFSAEGYYKWMNHLMDYKDNYQFIPASVGWEAKMTQGKGRSYGVELIARKESGKITGWIGYGLSWTNRRFLEINGGKTYPDKYDNRHKLNIVANWKISPKVELTGSWTYMTGNYVTASFENYEIAGGNQPLLPGNTLLPPYMGETGLDYYTTRNNYRLPAYHRLDLGINIYRPKKKGRMGIWNISIYNVYSYMAPVNIQKGYMAWYGVDCYFEQLGLIPIVPSVSYTYKF